MVTLQCTDRAPPQRILQPRMGAAELGSPALGAARQAQPPLGPHGTPPGPEERTSGTQHGPRTGPRLGPETGVGGTLPGQVCHFVITQVNIGHFLKNRQATDIHGQKGHLLTEGLSSGPAGLAWLCPELAGSPVSSSAKVAPALNPEPARREFPSEWPGARACVNLYVCVHVRVCDFVSVSVRVFACVFACPGAFLISHSSTLGVGHRFQHILVDTDRFLKWHLAFYVGNLLSPVYCTVNVSPCR